jgi:hypothetical protein
VLLAEWRRWWADRGEFELVEVLRERWDPYADGAFEAAVAPELARFARDLHEGASLLDVQWSLSELRRQHQPERYGRKWVSRDRAVARYVVAWYEQATGEHRER